MKIVFVGLSNKIGVEPFDQSTNSGQVIEKIMRNFNHKFFKMNLVSYAPIDKEGKLRYPTKKEIEKEIPKFIEKIKEINPNLILGFGSIVTSYLNKIDVIQNKVLFFKHPSYIYIYKRKELNMYIEDIQNSILQYENNFKN